MGGQGRHDAQLINVGMEDAVNESDRGALVGVLVGDFNMDLPGAAGEGSWPN
jgi:hypothetical protein